VADPVAQDAEGEQQAREDERVGVDRPLELPLRGAQALARIRDGLQGDVEHGVVEDDDEEDEPSFEDEKPAGKNPLDLLPPSSFNLDNWKRFYSNNETPDAMKYFWENVPFDEYSIWKVDYKYNDELTLTFMSNNLIGGFNTRLEGSRKYVFGTASVYGQNNDSVIQGAFVIRGQDYVPVFDVAPDYESYTFTKLDPKKPEDRAFVEDNWGWEKPAVVNGKEYKHADGKVFK